jgi:uridine kinase
MSCFIGITGGSGAGKSTLAYGLQDMFPELVEVVHFDDYQKSGKDVPLFEGMQNWDHPNAIDFESLLRDLALLKQGKNVEIMTKSAKYNPEYEEKGRISVVIKSKKIILVEGYMALTNKRIRNFFDYTIFLHLAHDDRMKRRTKFIDPVYNTRILLPMHAKYVEPTKDFADFVLDVQLHNTQDVLNLVTAKFEENNIL